MNSLIKVQQKLCETHSGKLYIVEEKIQNNNSIKYYAYEFLKKETLEHFKYEEKFLQNSINRSYFRHYQKLYLNSSQELFLFDHYLDGEFFDEKIIENKTKNQSFQKQEIQQYLKQLLEALYELHKNKKPGRLFSVQNILLLKSTQRIVLMEFGFGPDIKQNGLDILAPPEYLEQLIQNNGNQNQFDLKFDSWLLGAFLYNLIKMRPINCIEGRQNLLERCKYEKLEQYYEHLKQIQFIECRTDRYTKDLCFFVEGLLTCDKDKRLSFYDIYQSPFIRSLQIDGLREYEDFYSTLITIPDILNSVFQTKDLKGPLDCDNEINQTQHSKPKITEIVNHLDYYSIISKQPAFTNKKFNGFWLNIQLDYLRCYILANTGDKIITLLPKYNQPFHQVIAYFIKKMHFLILKELNSQLKSENYQNKPNQDWKSFLSYYSKELLKPEEVSQYLDKLKAELISIFNQHCNDHLNEKSKLPEQIKASLRYDQSKNYNMNVSSLEFFMNGYSEAVKMLLQMISQLIDQNLNNQELIQFKDQIYLCISITTSFNSETFQEQFKGLIEENKTIEPKDLINYIKFGKKNK